jgi:hypothetical protein
MIARGLLLGAALALVAGAFLLERYIRPPQRELYEAVVALAASPTPDSEMMQRLISDIVSKTSDQRHVNVNGPFVRDQINVALVDFDKVDRVKLDLPAEGALALPPNVIVLDLALCRNILLQALNDSSSVGQLLELMAAGKEDKTHTLAHTFGGISLQLRLANLDDRERVDATYGKYLAPALNISDMAAAFSVAFVFPIGHELWHIRPGVQVRSPVQSEERDADTYALEIAHRFLKQMPENETAGYLERQVLFIGVRYFQDRVLEKAYHGFRGLRAADFMVTLLHGPCAEADKVPWPQRFNNPGVVVGAIYPEMPMLSDQEAREVLLRLDEFANREHEHLLFRLGRFKDMLAEDPVLKGSADALDLSAVLLKFYQTRQTFRLLFRPDYQIPEAGNLSSDILLKALDGKPMTVGAVGCEDGSCRLAKVGHGYAEIYARGGAISVARISQPWGVEGVAALYAAAEQFVGSKRAEELMRQVSRQYGDCRLASDLLEGESYDITVTTMNEHGWLEMTAVALRGNGSPNRAK